MTGIYIFPEMLCGGKKNNILRRLQYCIAGIYAGFQQE
jgi:hypothetical protein